MNEELPELVKELPKIGEDVVAARPDISDETASKVFDLMANEKDMLGMAAAYDTQSRESIDLSIPNHELEGLPVAQLVSFDSILADVQNDFAALLEMQKEIQNEDSDTNSNE